MGVVDHKDLGFPRGDRKGVGRLAVAVIHEDVSIYAVGVVELYLISNHIPGLIPMAVAVCEGIIHSEEVVHIDIAGVRNSIRPQFPFFRDVLKRRNPKANGKNNGNDPNSQTGFCFPGKGQHVDLVEQRLCQVFRRTKGIQQVLITGIGDVLQQRSEGALELRQESFPQPEPTNRFFQFPPIAANIGVVYGASPPDKISLTPWKKMW